MQHLYLCLVTTPWNIATVQSCRDVCTPYVCSMTVSSRSHSQTLQRCRLATLPVHGQQPSKHLQPVFKRAPGTDGKVVGTVEVSLVPSTRTRYLTLNAPEVLHILGVLAKC